MGRKDKCIKLQQPVKTADGMGGRSSEWVTIAPRVWAEFKKPRLVTAAENGAIVSDMTREMWIWKRSDVRRGWRVIYGDRIFSVEHTYDPDRLQTVLVCREVVK